MSMKTRSMHLPQIPRIFAEVFNAVGVFAGIPVRSITNNGDKKISAYLRNLREKEQVFQCRRSSWEYPCEVSLTTVM